jgi:predicted HAD superfamily phosphohydrolase YqeG
MGKEKKHLLLDLDQTLISAEPSDTYDFKKNKIEK